MNIAAYDDSHKEWLGKHLSNRKGESKRKLITGHAHAEKEFLRHIWWPAFGHFEHLHPEYEVHDFFDGSRFLDFAYIRSGIHIAIEIDPYGTHYAKLDRRQYSNQWVRHMHLVNDSWLIVRISLDDVTERPRLWQQLCQQMVGHLFGDHDSIPFDLSSRERDILRMAFRLDRPIKLADVKTLLQCGYDTARKQLQLLEDKKWLFPDGKGTARTHAWRVAPFRKPPLL
ncbi:DNA-binding response regulator [Paenibacillus contaminans]|uniref:DNA-binding response regulator n=1 Tax=Paenibacillus contaminans TaxID=450362 RepID=A0A329LVG1_9BACL|nr:DNA-binding response regulator [Paenibacillus contaminans]RAV11132.1 DNA-binding response regulator [Paenibacillus contaminans]